MRWREWFKTIDKGFASFTLFPVLKRATREAPADPRSGATAKEDLLCTYPENQCTCKNGIGCVNVPVEDW